jgi:ribosomal protein L37AE/L43A
MPLSEHCCPICDDAIVPMLSAFDIWPCFQCLKCGFRPQGMPVPKVGILVPISRRPKRLREIAKACRREMSIRYC